MIHSKGLIDDIDTYVQDESENVKMESDDNCEVNNNTYNEPDYPGQVNAVADYSVATNEYDVEEVRAEKIRDTIVCYRRDIKYANERIQPLQSK